MMIFKIVQLLTGVHRIHSVLNSYGWKIPFVEYAYFDKYGFKKLKKVTTKRGTEIDEYHNCTLNGVY